MASPPKSRGFEWEDAGGIAVVRFTTRALRDDRVIRVLFEELDNLVDEAGRYKMVINFTGIDAFASYAIGKLIVLNNKLKSPDGRMAICCLTPIIDEILDIMKLRRQFNIYPNEQEALQSFET
jgi:anti-sigma B factor antagonist